MCKIDIFPGVNADGTATETRELHRCSAYRRGNPCEPQVFHHKTRSAASSSASSPRAVSFADPNNQFRYQNMPPSPRHTPVYQSGEESERSNASSGSKKKRASAIYVNGTKVYDLNHKRTRNERIVIVDSPPTPRTPPQAFSMPHTAPPSPNMNVPFNRAESPRDAGLRPIIVDERPRPTVQIVVDDNRRQGHRRGPSNSSRESGNTSSDSERRRHRDDRERIQDELRRQRLRARINAANAEISRRPAVPVPAGPQRAPTYLRPGVEVTVPMLDGERQQELVDAVNRLNLGRHSLADAERRARRSRERELEEDAAQRQRLMERMMPRRRATVGPGARRQRVMYDDGMYRWE